MNRHTRNLLIAAFLGTQIGSAALADNSGLTRVIANVKGAQPGVAFGQARHRDEVFSAGYFRNHFRMFLRIRKRNADPSLTPDAVNSAALVATLSRGGTPFAECILDRIVDRDQDFIPDAKRWDFGVAVTNLSGDLKAPRGTCDTDLSTASVQRGVPDAQAGDTVSVRLVGGSNDGKVVADGTFAPLP